MNSGQLLQEANSRLTDFGRVLLWKMKVWSDMSTSSNEPANQIGRSSEDDKTSNTAHNQHNNSFNRLAGDLILRLMPYLQPEEVCKLRRINKFASNIFKFSSECYWKIIVARFDLHNSIQSSNFFTQYLYNLYQHRESEYLHFSSMERSYEALALYHACQVSLGKHHCMNNIYGMVCDIFWLPSKKLALTLSKIRYYALPTIIAETEMDVYEFKKSTSYLKNSPSSFLPVNVASSSVDSTRQEYQYLNGNYNNPIQGCLGYAINLFQMNPQHEYLRYTILAMLFKNLLVFETVQSMSEYESTLTTEEKYLCRAVALDEYSENELNVVYPRFSFNNTRVCYYKDYQIISKQSNHNWVEILSGRQHEHHLEYVKIDLKAQLENSRHSYTIARYSY